MNLDNFHYITTLPYLSIQKILLKSAKYFIIKDLLKLSTTYLSLTFEAKMRSEIVCKDVLKGTLTRINNGGWRRFRKPRLIRDDVLHAVLHDVQQLTKLSNLFVKSLELEDQNVGKRYAITALSTHWQFFHKETSLFGNAFKLDHFCECTSLSYLSAKMIKMV